MSQEETSYRAWEKTQCMYTYTSSSAVVEQQRGDGATAAPTTRSKGRERGEKHSKQITIFDTTISYTENRNRKGCVEPRQHEGTTGGKTEKQKSSELGRGGKLPSSALCSTYSTYVRVRPLLHGYSFSPSTTSSIHHPPISP
ncbi:unnamed protein product [Ectocarpus sp. 12 AP-2014]